MSSNPNLIARVLVEALPYIQRFTGKSVVVKLGGAALARELDRMHGTSGFGDCQSMGELTAMHISLMLDIRPTSPSWERKT